MTKICQASVVEKSQGGVKVILHLLDLSNITAVVPEAAVTPEGVRFSCKDGIAKVKGSEIWTWTKNIYAQRN